MLPASPSDRPGTAPDGLGSNVRLIWSTDGFMSSQPSGPADFMSPVSPSTPRKRPGRGARPVPSTVLPSVRVPGASMGSMSARSWDDDVQLANKGGAAAPQQELRLLRRRNERLQTELQRSLNLYGGEHVRSAHSHHRDVTIQTVPCGALRVDERGADEL